VLFLPLPLLLLLLLLLLLFQGDFCPSGCHGGHCCCKLWRYNEACTKRVVTCNIVEDCSAFRADACSVYVGAAGTLICTNSTLPHSTALHSALPHGTSTITHNIVQCKTVQKAAKQVKWLLLYRPRSQQRVISPLRNLVSLPAEDRNGCKH